MINKDEGIDLLKILKMPTVDKIDIEQILSGQIPITDGISVRLSPKRFSNDTNVYLPSIHNCKDIDTIKQFVGKHKNKYNVFAHKTVQPELIGSASKLGCDSLVIETYKDFEHRKKEIIYNRVTIPIMGDRFVISELTMLREDEEDYKQFSKIITKLQRMPFDQYDTEYVFENGEPIFTDLIVTGVRDEEGLREYTEKLLSKNGEER